MDGERQLPEKLSRRSLRNISSIRGTLHRSAAMKVRLVASRVPGAVFELIRVLRSPLRRLRSRRRRRRRPHRRRWRVRRVNGTWVAQMPFSLSPSDRRIDRRAALLGGEPSAAALESQTAEQLSPSIGGPSAGPRSWDSMCKGHDQHVRSTATAG